MWLFNEGLYLVLILSVSVFAEKTKIRWFVILGWGKLFLFLFNYLFQCASYYKAILTTLKLKCFLFVGTSRYIKFSILSEAITKSSEQNKHRFSCKDLKASQSLMYRNCPAVFYIMFFCKRRSISPCSSESSFIL